MYHCDFSLKSISDSGDEEQISGQTDSQQDSLALCTDKENKADDSESMLYLIVYLLVTKLI